MLAGALDARSEADAEDPAGRLSLPRCARRARRLPWIALALPAALLPLAGPAAAQEVVDVPRGWSHKPSGLAVGTEFRLLFVTSTGRNASSSNIAHYNSFVQDRAAAGHAAIRSFSSKFKVVGSTRSVDARDAAAPRSTVDRTLGEDLDRNLRTPGRVVDWDFLECNGGMVEQGAEDSFSVCWSEAADHHAAVGYLKPARCPVFPCGCGRRYGTVP